MKIKPTFSVIIPTYNTGVLIRKTLDSLVNQTYKKFEVIVSDDGSKDDTLAIVREYSQKLNLVILENPNWGGPARPRNLGIKASNADWIAFLDHDDFWYKNKLEEVMKHLDGNDVLFHDLRIYNQDGPTFRKAKGWNILPNPFVKLMTEGNAILNSSVVVRKILIEEVHYIDESRELMTVEDFDLWLKIARVTNRFQYINKTLGGYLIISGQNMSGASEKQIERHTCIHNKYVEFLSDKDKKKSYAILCYAKARMYHKLLKSAEAVENYKKAFNSNVLSIRIKALVVVVVLSGISKIKKIPSYLLAAIILVVVRLIRPFFLVRFGVLVSTRIGHFAGNTELYLCERDAGINVPKNKYYLDLFYMEEPICNHQLAKMWRTVLHVWPRWLLGPVINLNRLIHGGEIHNIGDNACGDRDVHNLHDKYPSHLKFTQEDEVRGETELRKIGIPIGAKFVCLAVRDSAYLDSHMPMRAWDYHNYRDCDIQNYIQAAVELADRGYFVVRMGAKVLKPMNCIHPNVIDYAYNGMRSDFMDIYLAAKCTFSISSGLGWDGVPASLFKKPMVYTNIVPIGHLLTFSAKYILLTKRHFFSSESRELTLKEIFNYELGFCMSSSEYESKNIRLIEDSPEEICDAVIEMHERLQGTWTPGRDDEELQRQFWEIFSTYAITNHHGNAVHGKIYANFGAIFLRNNRVWLQ
jgi:putative glycosyltransferase (TIGR04372 family)